MIEDISGPDKAALTPVQKAEMYLEGQGVPVWGAGVSGDFFNAVGALGTECRMERLWPTIEPVPTIEEYVQQVIGRRSATDSSEVVAAAIERINPKFLERANGLISEMNALINSGITSQEHADALLEKVKAFSDWLYRREGQSA